MSRQDFTGNSFWQKQIELADVLEKQVAGAEEDTWTAPNGETGKSFLGYVKELFDLGGLPAVRFKTVEQMQTDGADLPDDTYAFVADDTDGNSGIYIKEGGVWVKSKYDIQLLLDSLKSSLAQLKNATSHSKKTDILNLIDANDSDVVRIGSDGSIYVKKLNGSLQKSIQDALNSAYKVAQIDSFIKQSSKNDSHFALFDANDTALIVVNKNGDVYLNNIKQSVQYYCNIVHEMQKNGIDKINQRHRYSKHLSDTTEYNESYQNIIEQSKSKYKYIAPIPKGSAKTKVSLGLAWIDEIKIETNKTQDARVIAGYDYKYRDGIGVAHPNVWAFDEYVFGYKYWMAISPYTDANELYELPYIYGTNDPALDNWELMPGFPTPFEQDPVYEDGSYRGHLSDPAITYDPMKGDIVMTWRKSLFFKPETGRAAGENGIMAARFDGVAWSEVYELLPVGTNFGESILSPAFVYNHTDNLFYMYYISNKVLRYRTSPTLDGDEWSEPVSAVLDKNNGKFWHLDMKFVEDKLVALLHADGTMSNRGAGDEYYIAVSSDFKNFNVSESSIVSTIDPNLYKATFIPDYSKDITSMQFKIVYTSDNSAINDGEQPWQLRVSTTNPVNLGV